MYKSLEPSFWSKASNAIMEKEQPERDDGYMEC